MRSAYRILVVEPEGKTLLGRPEDGRKMMLKRILEK
jgi:hypothetical protein